jgi:hypothetical protein
MKLADGQSNNLVVQNPPKILGQRKVYKEQFEHPLSEEVLKSFFLQTGSNFNVDDQKSQVCCWRLMLGIKEMKVMLKIIYQRPNLSDDEVHLILVECEAARLLANEKSCLSVMEFAQLQALNYRFDQQTISTPRSRRPRASDYFSAENLNLPHI